MPKIKTHRGAAKRFKRTKNGKFLRGKAFKQHILGDKTRKRKRRLRGTTTVAAVDAGGSGTRVILLENGTVTARPDGPPMNALLTDGFAGHLRQIVEAADDLFIASAEVLALARAREAVEAHRHARRETLQDGHEALPV